ncbi:MAG: GDP-L-fucose synthase [Candidatus Bathyarchaeota archaeon]|nr:GDP-L-fucose synthase [Candidatus Bathyarchaeota archaeon]
MSSFWANKKILVTGAAGFLGSHVVDNLVRKRGVDKCQISSTRSSDSDLRVFDNCVKAVEGTDVVIHLAARVGGIGFNQNFPGTLFYDNIIMGTQLIEASRIARVEKFVQVGTVCAYPKYTPVPFKEDDIWNGYPEETNAPYGIAKKALLVMAQAYRRQYGMNIIYLLPVNLYGPKDNFNPDSSHVIPALIKKFVDAKVNDEKKVIVWGTGNASREFLYVEDAAEGIISAAEKYDKPEPVNIGAGREITIKSLVDLVVELTGFKGQVIWDASKPDGQPRRCLDVTRAKSEFGFEAKTDFVEGLKKTIEWYIARFSGNN